MSYKLLAAFLFLILAIFLQLLIGGISGIWINFALVALVVAAFFLNFLELLPLCLAAVLVLNWQPAPSLEMALYVILPLAVFALRKHFPFKPWLGIPAAIILSDLIFYLIIGPRFLLAAPAIFFWDLAGELVCGGIFFKVYGTFAA